MMLRTPARRVLSFSGVSLTGLIAATMTSQAQGPSQSQFSVTPYQPRHASWPYQPDDFTRADNSTDSTFYAVPRFVTHIDDNAISQLRKYYDQDLPDSGRILDFCSSWISHYPQRVEEAVRSGRLSVIGLGMNRAELQANKVLDGGRIAQDLNHDPKIPGMGSLDAATCAVSIDYLNQPVEVLSSLREQMREGGMVHLVISNRCFPTKVIRRWLKITEDERLSMVGDYLHFSGWKKIEIVTVQTGKSERQWMVTLNQDPVWVVRAIK